jgi:hypothetical protein
MADPVPAAQPDPGYIQRLVHALRSMGSTVYSTVSPKANPNDPNDPTGKGGAAAKSTMDRQIVDAGG